MKNPKPLTIAIAILVLAVPFFAKDKIIDSKWTTTPIKIDGDPQDWPQDQLVVDKSNGVSYAFQNSASYVYCLFVFNDPKTLSTLNQTGLTLWVNIEGKEKKVHGLRFYRKEVTAEQLVQELEKQGQPLDDQRKNDILTKGGKYALFACDARNSKGETIPHPANTGVATYRIGKMGNSQVYELVVPAAMLEDPATKVSVDLTKPLKIGFEWGGATEDIIKQRAAQVGDRGAAASAGGGGGSLESMVSGGGGGSNAPSADLASMRRNLPKKYDFWLTVKFAQNPQEPQK